MGKINMGRVIGGGLVAGLVMNISERSEERRVGKECRL